MHLTAQTALNIPSESGHFVDWHLLEAFSGSPAEWQARCTWVGAADAMPAGRHLPDTRPWLGKAGVWNCTDVLRSHGVQVNLGQIIYAARPWRAVLDMVLAHATKGRVAHHVQLTQWFDPEADAAELTRLHTVALYLLGDIKTEDFSAAVACAPEGLQTLPENLRGLLRAWLALQTEAWPPTPQSLAQPTEPA